jgi:hypothetical protein
MNRHTRRARVRRAAKWAGVVVCAVIAAAWVVSLWRYFGYKHVLSSEYSCHVIAGRLFLGYWQSVRLPSQWEFRAHDLQIQWWAEWGRAFGAGTGLWSRWFALPLWMPFVAVALPTAWVFWRDRRLRPGHCACGYDLAGLAAGAPCPECGAAPA